MAPVSQTEVLDVILRLDPSGVYVSFGQPVLTSDNPLVDGGAVELLYARYFDPGLGSAGQTQVQSSLLGVTFAPVTLIGLTQLDLYVRYDDASSTTLSSVNLSASLYHEDTPNDFTESLGSLDLTLPVGAGTEQATFGEWELPIDSAGQKALGGWTVFLALGPLVVVDTVDKATIRELWLEAHVERVQPDELPDPEQRRFW